MILTSQKYGDICTDIILHYRWLDFLVYHQRSGSRCRIIVVLNGGSRHGYYLLLIVCCRLLSKSWMIFRSNERFLLIVRRLLVVQILRKSKVGYFALPAMPRTNKFKRSTISKKKRRRTALRDMFQKHKPTKKRAQDKTPTVFTTTKILWHKGVQQKSVTEGRLWSQDPDAMAFSRICVKTSHSNPSTSSLKSAGKLSPSRTRWYIRAHQLFL